MKKKLKDICTITMGQSPDSKTYNSKKNGLPFFQGNADFGEKYPTARVYCSEPKKIAESNDILISVRAPIGALNFSKEQCCIGRGLASLRVKETDLCGKEYLYAFLKSQNAELNRKGTGSTFSAIGKSALEDLIINLPTLSEQQKIAAELDTIQSAIDNKKQQLALLDEAVKSKFVEMFGENPVENGKWKVEKLGDVADIKIGPFGSLLHKNDYITGGHCLINPSHIKNNKIVKDAELSVSDEKYSTLKAYQLERDDIVLGRRGEMGRCAIVEETGLLCGTGSMIVRPNGKLKAFFLNHVLSSADIKVFLEDRAIGVTMKNINEPLVKSIPVPVIPLDLQNQFAAFVQQIDKSKSVVKQEIADLQELLDSKMQEYFDN